MNIWFLTSEFPPSFGGGIGMYVENVARMMSKDHKVTVLVRDKVNKIEYLNENLRVVRFKHGEDEVYKYLGYWTALSYQYYEEVIKLIKLDGKAPDLIEVQEYNAIGYYVLQNKYLGEELLQHTPIVVHLHTPTFELDRINQYTRYKFPNYWIGQMEKFCIRAADAVLSPSQFLADELQCLIPDKPIKVINLPYSDNELDDDEIQTSRNFDSDTILYFGRTEYRKGIGVALEVINKMWNKGYPYKLKIIGGDTFFYPKNKSYVELLEEKYHDKVKKGLLEFIPAIPPKELVPEILNCRGVIIPSIYENYPYTCLQAMWYGAPTIVSKSGGQAEMVETSGLNGIIFDWDNQDDLEEKLLQFSNLTSDDLKKMSNNAFQRIRNLCNIEKNKILRETYFKELIVNYKNVEYKEFPFNMPKARKLSDCTQYDKIPGLLSIIIPYYNLGSHVKQTLKSALETNYKDYEILIVNDGSTDKYSLEVLEEIKLQKNHNVRILNIENSGLSNVRNLGAKEAKGEFIAFLDADDMIDPDFYSRAISVLNQYENVSFVYSWAQYFEGSQDIWPTFNTEFPYLLVGNMLTPLVVVRKDDFINFGQNRKEMEYGMEDFDGWVSMVGNGCYGVSIPETLVKYCVRENSMSRAFNPNMVLYLYDRLSSEYPEIYSKYAVEVANIIANNGPGYLWSNPTLPHSDLTYSQEMPAYDSVVMNRNEELFRIANSRYGKLLIGIFFKLRLNRLFR